MAVGDKSLQGKAEQENSAKFLIEAYNECFREKRHYDILSWTLFAGVALVCGPLFKAIISTVGITIFGIPSSLIFSISVCLILFVYWRIYERNRFWGEVFNEKAREIERSMKFAGPAIAGMIGGITRKVERQNTDENGEPIAAPKSDYAPSSMHFGIRAILLLIGAASLLLALFQTGYIPR